MRNQFCQKLEGQDGRYPEKDFPCLGYDRNGRSNFDDLGHTGALGGGGLK